MALSCRQALPEPSFRSSQNFPPSQQEGSFPKPSKGRAAKTLLVPLSGNVSSIHCQLRPWRPNSGHPWFHKDIPSLRLFPVPLPRSFHCLERSFTSSQPNLLSGNQPGLCGPSLGPSAQLVEVRREVTRAPGCLSHCLCFAGLLGNIYHGLWQVDSALL